MNYHNVDIVSRSSVKFLGRRNTVGCNLFPPLFSEDGMVTIQCTGVKDGYRTRETNERIVNASHMHVRVQVHKDVDVKENAFLCKMYTDNVMDIYESKDALIVFSNLPDEYGIILPVLQSMMSAWEGYDPVQEAVAAKSIQRNVRMWLYRPGNPFVRQQTNSITAQHMKVEWAE